MSAPFASVRAVLTEACIVISLKVLEYRTVEAWLEEQRTHAQVARTVGARTVAYMVAESEHRKQLAGFRRRESSSSRDALRYARCSR